MNITALLASPQRLSLPQQVWQSQDADSWSHALVVNPWNLSHHPPLHPTNLTHHAQLYPTNLTHHAPLHQTNLTHHTPLHTTNLTHPAPLLTRTILHPKFKQRLSSAPASAGRHVLSSECCLYIVSDPTIGTSKPWFSLTLCLILHDLNSISRQSFNQSGGSTISPVSVQSIWCLYPSSPVLRRMVE